MADNENNYVLLKLETSELHFNPAGFCPGFGKVFLCIW